VCAHDLREAPDASVAESAHRDGLGVELRLEVLECQREVGDRDVVLRCRLGGVREQGGQHGPSSDQTTAENGAFAEEAGT
jgi:hypothetical protein